jgi:hypothetical protein
MWVLPPALAIFGTTGKFMTFSTVRILDFDFSM